MGLLVLDSEGWLMFLIIFPFAPATVDPQKEVYSSNYGRYHGGSCGNYDNYL